MHEGATILDHFSSGLYAADPGHLALTDVVFLGNQRLHGDGGAIRCSSQGASDPIELVRVWIEGNAADNHGGGLHLDGCDAVLTDSVVTGNTASGGGGIATEGSVDLELYGTQVSDNAATGDGGGIRMRGGGLLGQGVLLTGNEAGGSGGGVSSLAPATTVLQLTNARVAGNRASGGSGGGIDGISLSVDLANVAVAGNHASGDGGGLSLVTPSFDSPSDVTLRNVALVGNGAGTNGGAIHLDEAEGFFSCALDMASTVMAFNAAANAGGGVYTTDVNVTAAHCDAWDNLPAPYAGVPDPTGGNGNVSLDPQFLDLAPADPLDWDLHLALGSPLIDAGDPAIADPDASPSDMGPYGGPAAGSHDLDHDSYPEWWQPGPYDPVTYPGLGWDCDDLDGGVYPGSGC